MSPIQMAATSRGIRPTLELIPPLDHRFHVYGDLETNERARQWALRNRYLLVRGVPDCAHGLYMMGFCPSTSECQARPWVDHINLWTGFDFFNENQPRPFLLAAPYADEIPESAYAYAATHGLEVEEEDWRGDGWYGDGALPIRMSPADGPGIWPIELEILALNITQPFAWPDEDS